MTIRTEEFDEVTGLPIILSNVTIYANLNFMIHGNGAQFSLRRVSCRQYRHGWSVFYTGRGVERQVRVKSLVGDTNDHLEAAASMLDALVNHGVKDEVGLVATFPAEQLRLVSKPLHGRRYSSFLLRNAVVWDRKSPKLYRMMQNCAQFCLPHPRTLRRLTSALRMASGLDGATMTYLRMRVARVGHNSLGRDGRHPEFILNLYSADEDRIYTMYDTVHIFKNMYYGLLKHKTLTVPPFTSSENPSQLKVNFSHLTKLYNMERGHPGKLAFKLTDKVLKPSALERVNVGLAASATHESTCKALRHFAAQA
ncbi:hypothetical protein GWK47_034936 [Chionoecetes opilio]|uniref:Uncharacterized protein n=1 Tax=Chionoecetes opilio TaxID=41210 RepID=A0A8J5D0I3_CHIOP|nr:hypothetical protein GWK47_034936 [Chionoecetes opilio]